MVVASGQRCNSFAAEILGSQRDEKKQAQEEGLKKKVALLVEHVLKKPRTGNQPSLTTPVRYYVDEKGLIRYSRGGVGTPATAHPMYVPVDRKYLRR